MGKTTPHSMRGFLLGQAAAGHRSPSMPPDVLRMIHQGTGIKELTRPEWILKIL